MIEESFVEILFSKYFLEGHTGYIEIRFIHKASGKTFPKFIKYENLQSSKLKEEINRLNKTHHVYFGVNPRPLSKKKKQDDIKNIACLWVDVDGKDFNGGKKEALSLIHSFPVKPTIIVDSGNGYHCYFVLEEPLINITKEQRLELKRILSGVVNRLQGDKQAVNLDRVMRLPGTYNIKKEKKECKIVHVSNKFCDLSDFEQFKDEKYTEIEIAKTFPVFGTKKLLITYDLEKSKEENLAYVKELVNSLEIDPKTKNRVLTGHCLTEKLADKTRSGRDISIMYSLIMHDYNYPTIRSIFFNPYCRCSDRVREKGHRAEDVLQWDVRKALQYVEERQRELTPEQQEIQKIRAKRIKREGKLQQMSAFITERLLTSILEHIGEGFRDEDRNIYYFFDKNEKLLMDLESITFYCYLRDKFGLLKKDFEEIKDAVMTTIWRSKKKIKSHTFAYFDDKNFILYISDHFNGIYKLDGEKIEHVDNGTDGVFFEFNSEFTPLDIDVTKLKGINYFELPQVKPIKLPKTNITLEFPKDKVFGFNWAKFTDPKNPTYLKKFLIDRASFAPEEEYGLSPEDQKILLTVYFYSLFFESIQKEKPIICFVGLKESGKSFIAESIGKILFGDSYQIRHMPTDPRDFHTLLGTNYYLAFDNIDMYVSPELLDIFCVAATGGTVERRMLYTDREVVKLKPKVFLAITTREAKFKRDDLVSRLILFNTKKITKALSRSYLFKTLSENRDKMMSEVLINLNSIIKLLKMQKEYNPPGKSRIADFELFTKKISRDYERSLLRVTSEDMTTTKDIFTLEGDPLYEILNYTVNEQWGVIENISSYDLHERNLTTADILKMADYKKRYKSPLSLAKRLNSIKDELNKVMIFKTWMERARQRKYSFYPFDYNEEEEEKAKRTGSNLIPMTKKIEQIRAEKKHKKT